MSKSARINTTVGNINIVTQKSAIDASSNNGRISLDTFSVSNSIWKLKTINGDITVVKQ